MASRPELQAPPEIFYNEAEARKYTFSSRIIEIQAQLSERALELLALPDDGIPRLLLDIGCGSGLSGETLTENGHQWIGLDISQSMLDVALERDTEGDLILADMGQGLGIRPGVLDGAISISAVQVCSFTCGCSEFSTLTGIGSQCLQYSYSHLVPPWEAGAGYAALASSAASLILILETFQNYPGKIEEFSTFQKYVSPTYPVMWL